LEIFFTKGEWAFLPSHKGRGFQPSNSYETEKPDSFGPKIYPSDRYMRCLLMATIRWPDYCKKLEELSSLLIPLVPEPPIPTRWDLMEI